MPRTSTGLQSQAPARCCSRTNSTASLLQPGLPAALSLCSGGPTGLSLPRAGWLGQSPGWVSHHQSVLQNCMPMAGTQETWWRPAGRLPEITSHHGRKTHILCLPCHSDKSRRTISLGDRAEQRADGCHGFSLGTACPCTESKTSTPQPRTRPPDASPPPGLTLGSCTPPQPLCRLCDLFLPPVCNCSSLPLSASLPPAA